MRSTAARSRVLETLVVAALVLTVPARERLDGCTACPVDCPMHASRTVAAKEPGCHRRPAAAAPGGCVLRAACGHRAPADAPGDVPATLAAVLPCVTPPPAGRVPASRIGRPCPGWRDPPDEPPRTLRA